MSRRVAAVVEQCWHRVPGGTAVSTVRTLDAIAARSTWDVVGIAARHRSAPAALAVPTVPVRHLIWPRPVLYETWHRWRRPRLPRDLADVEIVHATGGVIPPAGEAGLVVTIHDLAFLRRPEHFTKHGVAFMTRAFELAAAEADRVIVPSAATAEECRDHGIDEQRLRIVPWGVAAATVTDEMRASVRERHGLPDEFVLWVGSAEPRKNLAGLIAAVRSADLGCPLVLAGPDGWGVVIGELLDAAPPGTRHLGQVEPGDLPVLYDLATVFVYPSLQEGFGMPVLEAMAQGTAVITSRGTATEEVGGDAVRLIDPFDVDDLGGALSELVADADERRRLATAGRERAAGFSWDATAGATEAVYDEVAG